jgi:hypothetical protein
VGRAKKDEPFRKLLCQLRGDRTETIPVKADFALPLIGRDELFVYIEAADGSEVCFRQEDILTLHLKD